MQIGALTTWAKMGTAWVSSFAVSSTGKLYAWGKNNLGQLGLGDTSTRYSPVQVGALTTWASVAGAKTYAAAAITTTGKLYTWGYNFTGILGKGNTTSYSSPVQVGSLTTWAKIVLGWGHALALTTDGKLFSWGANNVGQLGNGNTTYRSSPVQVGALTTWTDIAATSVQAGNASSFGISNGKLYSWGANYFGQLGRGNTTYYSSPVQVGALTTWSKVFGGGAFFLAISSTGKLYSCGKNAQGQLGLGDTTDRSSPVQVGALATWSTIGAGQFHTIGIRTDGKLFAWGSGGSGQLGLGNTNNYSSPVQVGSLTTWTTAAVGMNNFTLAR